MKHTKIILAGLMALAAGGTSLQAQDKNAQQEVTVAVQGLGIGSMPFRGSQSWIDQPGLAIGFGVGYTYWLNERIGLHTGLRLNNLSHNHVIKSIDMPFDAMLPLSSLGFPTGTDVRTVSLHSSASHLQENQTYTFIELPLQAALRFDRILVNLGISLAKAVNATAYYNYSDPACEVTALPDMRITMTPPVPLTLDGETIGQVPNVDMVKPFFFLLDAEAAYRFPLADATSVDVGLYGRLAPITHKTQNTADAYSIQQADATYQLLQPSTTSMVERIGYYEVGVSVGINFSVGGQKERLDGDDAVVIPGADRAEVAAEMAAMKAAREEAERELAAAKNARAKAEGELAALETARKRAESDINEYRQQAQQAQREAQQAAANRVASQTAPVQTVAPVRTQGTSQYAFDKMLFNFDYNKFQPKYDNETEANLRALCGAMQNNPNLKVTVIGHTDNVGTKRNNNKMGRKRAYAVKRLMVTMGAPEENIAIVTRGENEPKDTNRTKDGRANNRRVTLEQR